MRVCRTDTSRQLVGARFARHTSMKNGPSRRHNARLAAIRADFGGMRHSDRQTWGWTRSTETNAMVSVAASSRVRDPVLASARPARAAPHVARALRARGLVPHPAAPVPLQTEPGVPLRARRLPVPPLARRADRESRLRQGRRSSRAVDGYSSGPASALPSLSRFCS